MTSKRSMERPSTRSSRRIRLIPRHPIFLTRNGLPGETEVASAFRSAWRLVPLAARRKILDYWCDPFLEVVDDLPGDRPAEVSSFGQDIRFLGPAFAKMPGPACVGLVLRVLAHVYHCARFEPNHRVSSDLTEDVRERCEGIAIGTVAFLLGLGLFVYALRDWELGRA